MNNDDTQHSTLETLFSLGSNSHVINKPWAYTSTLAFSVETPKELPKDCVWKPICVPGTLGNELTAAQNTIELESFDWWYQCEFNTQTASSNQSHWHLQFDGLATLADVWLNDELILSSQNMFIGYKINVSEKLSTSKPNRLLIVFRSLNQALSQKRPRPRWKTNLVDNQQLRWFRTSLLGHIPGWAHHFSTIGPWRPIYLVESNQYCLDHFQLNTWLENQHGQIKLNAKLTAPNPSKPKSIILRINNNDYSVDLTGDKTGITLNAHITLNEAPLWWPHTHGKPNLLDYQLIINEGKQTTCIKSGKIGFKKIELLNEETVAFMVNGKTLFCRGACWTTNDLKTLSGNTKQLKESLLLAKNAGLNMLRIGGTMIYESTDFYQLCDELGILVWQDFMFANMDYPIDDPDFESNVYSEIHYQLQRLHTHPCIAAYCGNSEVEQQATMFGISEEVWKSRLFYQTLPDACQQWHAAIPYLPSSPSQGSLPFSINTGISHYFAIGAYKRPLNDPSLSKVKFTSECLGFSNIPCEKTLQESFANPAPAVHHPTWKAGVPRDNTAGWDFEDIRDFYLETLFKLKPIELRYSDNARYIALSQIVTGEVMQTAYNHWRGGHGQCNGALIWFFKDILPGAGWGIIDHLNRPKPVYYYLKRAWAKQIITLNDEQLDGLSLTTINETDEPLKGTIELRLIKNDNIEIAQATQNIESKPYSINTYSTDEMLGRFYDTNYAYRFGPPKHDVVIANLKNKQGATLSESFYFPNGLQLPIHTAINVDSHVYHDGENLILSLTSDRFLQAAQIHCEGYFAEDNYFHLQPDREKSIHLSKCQDDDDKASKSIKITLKALNFPDTLRIQL